MPMLLDTSVLFAFASVSDHHHHDAVKLIRSLGREEGIIVSPVLIELFNFVALKHSQQTALQILKHVRALFCIQYLDDDLLAQIHAIMTKYAAAKFDFTDASIMAAAEHLGINKIATFNRDNFLVYRRANGDSLRLYPEPPFTPLTNYPFTPVMHEI